MLKESLKSYIDIENIKDLYEIELESDEKSFIFHINEAKKIKHLPLLKKYLIIKNRETNKEIRKKIEKNVRFSHDEMKKLGEEGFLDAYLDLKLLKAKALIRIDFKNHHKGKLISSDDNLIFEAYQTINKGLSFRIKRGVFKSYIDSIAEENNKITLYGKIRLFKAIKFDNLEIISESNKNGFNTFPCEIISKSNKNGIETTPSELYDNHISFKSVLDINIDDYKKEDLNSSWSLEICLKNGEDIIDSDLLLANELSSFKTRESYYLKSLKLNNDYYLLLYATKGFLLKYRLPDNELYHYYQNKARNIDRYKYYRENLKIDENLVFFESFHGKFNNSPKYLYLKMLELGYDDKFKFVWSYDGDKDEIPGNPIIVSPSDEEYFKYLASSKYRINSATFKNVIDKRKELIYLQTWHGTPLKRLGHDIEVEDYELSWNHFNNEVSRWNYLVSANEFSTKTFKRAFKYKNEILETGYPANDIFYNYDEDMLNDLKEKIKIPNDKKIILYAPTFRDNKTDLDGNHIFDLDLDLESLHKEFEDKYLLIIKTHYVVSENLKIPEKMKDFIIDLSNYDDIHELYLLSDILITDYSSAFFDYAHSKRPILFFMPDLEEYINSRGIYEEILNELPGPKLANNEELIKSLKDIDSIREEYSAKYDKFYEKYSNIGHGDACEAIIKQVFNQ